MNIIELLELTVEKSASDLHITVDSPPMIRILGDLTPCGLIKLTPEDTERLVMSILSDAQKEVLVSDRSIDIAYSLNSGVSTEKRFRVNAFYQRGSIAAVFRRLSERILSIDELMMPKSIGSFAALRDGLILVTGPTGSGKSTTLAAMLDAINEERACHIITIEDPIEYIHIHKKGLVNQRELYSDVNTFSDALKYALRQDPDVILVGEMRDLDTIRTAVMAAETGHLVFSTLHSRDSVSTINRIIGVFPESEQPLIRQQLSLTLKGIVSQRLLKRTDTPGLIPAVEVMIVTNAISNLIRSGKEEQIYSALETGGIMGMQIMEEALCNLCRQGSICENSAMANAKNPKLMEQRLNHSGRKR
jgi:twitching motility protein PilT